MRQAGRPAAVPSHLAGCLLGGLLAGLALPGLAADEAAAPAAAAAGSSDAVVTEAPADAATPAPRPATPAAAAPAPAPADAAPATGTNWGLAPIRWGGSVGLGLRRIRSDSNGDTREQIYEMGLRASSYIAEPWIARISGDLALTSVKSDTSNDVGGAFGGLRGTTITGNAILNVFPTSRFPFQASVSASDSRSDGLLVNNDYTRRRLSLRQDYRPQQGTWSVFGQYDRSDLSGTFGHDTVDRVGGGFTLSLPRQTLNLDGNWSVNHRTSEGDSTEKVGIARHTFRIDDTLTVESLATYADSDLDFRGSAGNLSGRTTSWQALSFGSWIPADSPWRATGSVRYFQTASDFSGVDTKISNVGASGSLTYQVNRNLNLFGSANVNATTTDAKRLASSSESVGLNYASTPLVFGNYSYNWYGSANLNNVTAPSAAQRTLASTLGHSLQRNWLLSPVTSLYGSLGQTVNSTRASGVGALSTTNLVHTANLSLRAMASDALVGYLGLNLSDSRTRGDAESSFDLVNVQLNGTWRISALSELNANLTWQKTLQHTGVAPTNLLLSPQLESQSRDSTVSGSVVYSHSRAFNVRGLQYSLRLTGNTYQTDSRQTGNPDATREQVTRDIDQRLTYRIGRLNTQLQLRTSEIDGKKNALIYFKVIREFGAY